MKSTIHISDTQKTWVQDILKNIVQLRKAAIAQRDKFLLVLSGGHTPAPVYTALSQLQTEIDWERTYIFWGDERCVPPDNPASNYKSANETLLMHAPIPPENVFRMQGELDPVEGAKQYAQVLDNFFAGDEIKFDLILLGLGEDGHTASLFPGTPALKEVKKSVIENFHTASNMWRITLTYPTITNARNIFFLVKGEGKAGIVAKIINQPEAPPLYPAKILINQKEVSWFLDEQAAKFIHIME